MRNIVEPSYDDDGLPDLPDDEYSLKKEPQGSKVSFGLTPLE